ncbi:MAG TPA: hypothetical protein VFS21_04325 [Roseiflexaceae bacterium]|nr:hypothetical protein [Roseiflexaceae bacterium]
MTRLFWINTAPNGRLALMARPRGGDWLEDDIRALGYAGVDTLVSLLTPDEVAELDLGAEQQLCAAAQIRFLSLPIRDRQTPPLNEATRAAVREIADLLAGGAAVAVHCRMGIGRASLVSAATLALAGVPPDLAFAAIERARGCPVPDTPEQRAWVAQFWQRYGPAQRSRTNH